VPFVFVFARFLEMQSRNGFQRVFHNTIAELWRREDSERTSGPVAGTAVVVVNGNHTDFDSALSKYQYPAFAADAFVCLTEWELVQADYVKAAHDPEWDPQGRHRTDTNREYTRNLMTGLAEALIEANIATDWLIVGLSAGCVTAVALAHKLLHAGHSIRGLVADSGVPGSEDPLPPELVITLFRYTADFEFWQGGKVDEEWRRRGFTNMWDRPYNGAFDRHACKVTAKCVRECLSWYVNNAAPVFVQN